MPKEYHGTFMGNASTRLYMAPEIFLNKYRRRADIFSLGLIFHTMVTRSVVKVDGTSYYGSCLQNDYIGQCIAKHIRANTLNELSFDSLFSHPEWKNDTGRKLSVLIKRMLIISKDERLIGPELLKIYERLFAPNLPTEVAPKSDSWCTLL
jgi:serine/threonine protein kinase